MEDLKIRIAKQLTSIFPNATIYTENQSSGFEEPSFYIAKNLTRVNNRFFGIQDRIVSYQVIYFADPDNSNADIDRVEGLLLDNFMRLGSYATVRNREFTVNQTERTLIMAFDLMLNMYPISNTPMQRSLDINERTKKDGR